MPGSHTHDHELKVDSTTKRFKLARRDDGSVIYQVSEDVPQYRDSLKFIMRNWQGGHGQFSMKQGDAYCEGQSIDTTQESKVILGPLINSVGIGASTNLGANPVCFCWYAKISKLMVATATRVFWYDSDTGYFVMKWDKANHAWAASHAFTTADWVRPTTYNGHIYECTSAGTSDGTEPTWGTTDAGTTTDGGATFTCRSITITDMKEYDTILYVALGMSDLYYASADAVTFTVTDLADHHAVGFFTAPNAAGTSNRIWKFVTPNQITATTNGQAGGTAWDAPPNYIGDTSNNITNIFMINDNLMIGRTDNLYSLDVDGGIHPWMDGLKNNRDTNNFKYVVDWQTAIYFSLTQGLGEIVGATTYQPVGPLTGIDDINKAGVCVGLASDKDFIYVAMDEGTNTHIYKGREISRTGGLRWEWCPWVFLSTNACATTYVCQHTSTDRRLWFGYGNYAAYVILTDNPLVSGSGATYAASGFIRFSYDYGTNPYWDKLFQSVITETKNCTANITVTPKYLKDTETTASALTDAVITNGVVKTNLTDPLSCKRIQFELDFATNSSSTTPVVTYFEARGIEKPEKIRIHETTYLVGDEPSQKAETIRDFFRTARASTNLIRFADLRYGESAASSSYVWVTMMPGYPQEVDILHEKGRAPEMGIRCRFQEVDYTIS